MQLGRARAAAIHTHRAHQARAVEHHPESTVRRRVVGVEGEEVGNLGGWVVDPAVLDEHAPDQVHDAGRVVGSAGADGERARGHRADYRTGCAGTGARAVYQKVRSGKGNTSPRGRPSAWRAMRVGW